MKVLIAILGVLGIFFFSQIVVSLPVPSAQIQSTDITSGLTLTNPTINSATLNSATLNSATLSSATLNSATLNSATLSSATLNSATLNSATLNSATLNSATLNSATLSSVTLNSATINSAAITNGSLSGTVSVNGQLTNGGGAISAALVNGTLTSATVGDCDSIANGNPNVGPVVNPKTIMYGFLGTINNAGKNNGLAGNWSSTLTTSTVSPGSTYKVPANACPGTYTVTAMMATSCAGNGNNCGACNIEGETLTAPDGTSISYASCNLYGGCTDMGCGSSACSFNFCFGNAGCNSSDNAMGNVGYNNYVDGSMYLSYNISGNVAGQSISAPSISVTGNNSVTLKNPIPFYVTIQRVS